MRGKRRGALANTAGALKEMEAFVRASGDSSHLATDIELTRKVMSWMVCR